MAFKMPASDWLGWVRPSERGDRVRLRCLGRTPRSNGGRGFAAVDFFAGIDIGQQIT